MGDITSGGVKDDAAANVDFGGGGGQDDYYSASQNIPTSTPSTPVSLGFGGAKGDIVARTPTSVPTVSPPMSPFQLGFGGAQKVPNYMDDLNTLMGGGGSSADASAVSVSDSGPDTTTTNYMAEAFGVKPPSTSEIMTTNYLNEAFERKPPSVPDTTTQNYIAEAFERKPPSVPDTTTQNYLTEAFGSPGAMSFASDPPAAPSVIDQQPKADANQLAKYYEGLIAGKGSPKNEQEKTFLSRIKDFLKNPGSTILGFFENLLQGDANFTGPSPAQLDLMGVPGPGPAVGGGVPSPSGTGTDMPVTTMPETPAETVIKKDPCPPGFKLDPILNQCMPIVKAAPTPPPMPTLPQPTAPTGGGIANVYPFTLTPPVGAPIGTVAPIRFTPK